MIQWILLIFSSVLTNSSTPVILNLVLIGFHQPEESWVSDYDLERNFPNIGVTLSLGKGPYDRLRKNIEEGTDICTKVMETELISLSKDLELFNKGITLFVLNLNKEISYSYCEGQDGEEYKVENPVNLHDRGEAWGNNHKNIKNKKCSCSKDDTCRVNAWISNSRVGWVDLTAQGKIWGNRYGISLPSPPTYRLTLEQQQEKAKLIKEKALLEKNCKECKGFLNAWSSLLDRASHESDFSRAYDIVARASDELESLIAGEFAVTTTRVSSSEEVILSIPSSNSIFLAHLSLVVKSFVSRVLLPFNAEQLHEDISSGKKKVENDDEDEEQDDDVSHLDVPTSRVTIHLYLVRGESVTMEDSGPSEEDLNLIRKELERLASPPFQTVSVVVHRLDLDHDPVLGSAYAFSLHSMVIPTMFDGRYVGKTKHYLNAREFRQVLLKENDRSHFTSFSVSNSGDHNTELPVFWFYGVDSSLHPEPLFIDGYHRALHLKDMVLVVESKRSSIELQGVYCGTNRVKVSVSRPIRAALVAIAQLWWSANLGSRIAERYIDESISDWSWAVGVGDARGLSLFEEREGKLGNNLLSNILVDAFHRSTILEALRHFKRYVEAPRKSMKNLDFSRDISAKKQLVVNCSRINDWDCAFQHLVEILEKTSHLTRRSNHVKKCESSIGITSKWWKVWRYFKKNYAIGTIFKTFSLFLNLN